MAVEWARVALAGEISQRVANFQLQGSGAKGILPDGVSFLRSGPTPGMLGVSAGLAFPSIRWSTDTMSGANTNKVMNWDHGTDEDGLSNGYASFTLSGSYADQALPSGSNLQDGVWGCVFAVPTGRSAVAAHEISVSGLIANEGTTTASVGDKIHFQIWRAYISNNIAFGSSQSTAGVEFELVAQVLKIGQGQPSPIYGPAYPGSMRHFDANTITAPVDPSECAVDRTCLYAISCWCSNSDNFDNTLAQGWPGPNGSDTCSVSLQVQVAYTPA